MFGDPSGLAPEKHKSGGGGQDRLLGDNSMAQFMEQIMQANGSAMTYSYKLPVCGFISSDPTYTPYTIYHDTFVGVQLVYRYIEHGHTITENSTFGIIGYETVTRSEGGGGIAGGGGSAGGGFSIGSAGGGGGGGSSTGSANDNGRVADREFDYDEVKAIVFEFTHDWNTINKLEHAADLANLFLYYLDNPSLDGEVYKENFLFLKCLAHYQTGQNRILLVDAKTIDVPRGTKESVNLFEYSKITDEGLALGKVSIFESAIYEGEYEIGWDTYDFDIPIPLKDMIKNPINMPSILFSTITNGRNIGTAISYSLHNVPFAFTGDGPFHIGFVGTIKR